MRLKAFALLNRIGPTADDDSTTWPQKPTTRQSFSPHNKEKKKTTSTLTHQEEVCSSSSGGSPELTAPDNTDAPNSFDEIENAFAQVSLVADALLDSINDDSLRGKERRRERQQASRRCLTNHNSITDSDDDRKGDIRNNLDDYIGRHRLSYSSYDGNDCDVSTLGDMTLGDGDESIDGSLVHDVQNLKSVTRAMQVEMQKQEEAFNANVTTGSDGKSFFSKLEEAKAAKDAAKTPRIKNRPPTMLGVSGKPTTISVRNGKGRVPILIASGKPKRPSFLEQLRQFCEQWLGKKPNLPLLLVNVVIWLILFKLVFAASRDRLMDGEGRLQMAFAS